MERIAGVCRQVKQLVGCYEEGREPDKLDFTSTGFIVCW